MVSKHYCYKCQNLIDEGKEIKVHQGTNYSSSRYSSRPQNYIIYYLCPTCCRQWQEERQAKRDKIWYYVSWSLLVFLLILILAVIAFFVYQRRQDQKIDKITKKAQK